MKKNSPEKVLVTGGAGFIGSNLVDALVEEGLDVSIIDNLETGQRGNINPKANFFQVDIRKYEEIAPIFENIDCVLHLAALPRIQPAIRDPFPAHHTNATGTLNVLTAAQRAGVKRLIYSGSSSVYGKQSSLPFKEDMKPDPLNPYAVQKLVGEMYCRNFSELYRLPTVILRYFNVYGPREILEGAYATVIGIFRQQLKQGLPMTIVADGGEKTRDFTHVRDVVRANILAMGSDKVGKAEIINIGTGKNYSIKELAEMFRGPIEVIPPRPGETVTTLADNKKAKELLGWEPTVDLPSGVEELKKLHGLA
ncbi:MAG: Nucleotide sugar epimerase [Parcubacteria group bacterium GW2011_GWB1_43_6]|nr:MAG: Nucleotide sugar epimerase [Parcubacteria group bacterium GW2011_GWB1_43_6]